jgi:hypothetical protein
MKNFLSKAEVDSKKPSKPNNLNLKIFVSINIFSIFISAIVFIIWSIMLFELSFSAFTISYVFTLVVSVGYAINLKIPCGFKWIWWLSGIKQYTTKMIEWYNINELLEKEQELIEEISEYDFEELKKRIQK